MREKIYLLKFAILIGDVLLFYLALFSALMLRYTDFSFWPGSQTKVFLFHFSIIHVFWLIFLFALDFYEIPPFKKIYEFLRNLVIFVFLAGSLGVIYFYLKPQAVIAPKTILVLDVLIFSLFLSAWRYLFNKLLRTKNFKEKIIIAGDKLRLDYSLLEKIKESNYEIAAFFDISQGIDELKEIIENNNVDTIVFSFNIYESKELCQQIFSNLPLELNFVSFNRFYETITGKIPLNTIDELWFLENISQAKRRTYELAKRSFDVFFSIFGLVLTGIIFPFVALAVKIDSKGPILYSQKRVGLKEKEFNFYKFRTMITDAEEQGPQWASKDDPRITRVGKFLRITHLDEFPQFWNILKGELSFVGPRPERPEFVEKLKKEIPYYDIRHLIKPGFTGWAQIKYQYGASVKEAEEKLSFDLFYIKNRSFFFDLAILFKTIQLVFR